LDDAPFWDDERLHLGRKMSYQNAPQDDPAGGGIKLLIRWAQGAPKIANFIRLKVQFLLKTEKLQGSPSVLVIETGAVCNLRCPLCPTGSQTLRLSQDVLSLSAFQDIIRSCGSHLTKIMLFNWGEPLLNPDLADMVRFARARGISVAISTNLNRLDYPTACRLLDAGLSEMIVSISGATQRTYERYHVGGSLVGVLRRLRWLARLKAQRRRSQPRIVWRFLIFKHNEHEAEKARLMAERLKIDFESNWPNVHNTSDPGSWRASQAPDGPRDRKKRYWPCRLLWEGAVIHSDGSVLPCCMVKDVRYSLGNIHRDDFHSIWNNAGYRAIRRHIAGEPAGGNETLPCERCPHGPVAQTEALGRSISS